MNYLAVAIAGYLCLGLEEALRPPLMLGQTGIAPYFVLVLVAYIATNASTYPVLWTSLLLGLAVDLTAMRPIDGGTAVINIIGPNALGYVAGAYLVLTLRGVMIRRNPVTLAFLTVCCSLLAQLVVVTLYLFRSLFDSAITFNAFDDLAARAACCLYTVASAFVLGYLLERCRPWFGFSDQSARRVTGRR